MNNDHPDDPTAITPARDHIPTRDGEGRYVRSADTAYRDAEAVRMRSRGATLQQIADELGFADRSIARRAIQRGLADVTREAAEEHVQLQLDQLDALTVEVMGVLEREHLVVSAGRLMCGPDGLALRDDGPKLAAIDRLLKIMERRARLLGLDAPTRTTITTTPGGDIDAAVAELAAAIAGPATDEDDK